jgi:hypothetical protein
VKLLDDLFLGADVRLGLVRQRLVVHRLLLRVLLDFGFLF